MKKLLPILFAFITGIQIGQGEYYSALLNFTILLLLLEVIRLEMKLK